MMQSSNAHTEFRGHSAFRRRLGADSSDGMLRNLLKSAQEKLGAGYKLDVKQQQSMGRDMSQEERKKRGKELDDGFFEGYADTIDKHDRIQAERRQRGDKLIEDDSSGNGSDHQSFSGDRFSAVPEEAEREELYRVLLRCMHHQVIASDKSTTANLHSYMQKVFNVTEQQHSVWMADEIQMAKPPQQFLRVSVIKGRNLPPKDSNDLSDPFCVLGLVTLPPGYLDGKRKTRKLQKLVEDKKSLHTTHVISETLNPEWNETFLININLDSIQKQVLQIDVWDSDENVKSVKSAMKAEVKSGMGFFRYIGQVGESMVGGGKLDFMGRTFIHLQDIPAEGVEKWFKIVDKKQRPLDGSLQLSLRFVAQQLAAHRSASFRNEFSRHVKMHQLFSSYECSEFIEHGGLKWNMQLSNAAKHLLHVHASQHSFTSLEEALSNWIVVAAHHERHDVDYKYMINVVDILQQEWNAVLVKGTREQDVLDAATIELFVESCDRFHQWCFRALSKLRVIYPATHKKTLVRLSSVLECIKKVYNFPIAKEQLQLDNLPLFVNKAIRQSTEDWFERQEAMVEPQVKTPDAEVKAFVSLASDVVLDLYQTVKIYSNMFQSVDVDIVALVFEHLDLLLSPRIEERMKDFHRALQELDITSDEFKTLSTASFELYLALKDIYKYKSELPTGVASKVELFTKLHIWFKPLVARWVELAKVKTVNRINRAIELDKVERVSERVMYSTSAVDTVQCLLQLCEFWKRLDWPFPSLAYTFVFQLTEVICDAAIHYGNCLQTILDKSGYYDDEGQFDVTEQLCVTLNDIQYVRESLHGMSDYLGWDKVLDGLTQENSPEAVEHSRESLYRFVKDTNDVLSGRCDDIVKNIGKKMGVDIDGYVQPLITDTETVAVEESITGLMDYLASNLQTLSNNLFSDIFKLILLEIYEVCIGKIREMVIDKDNLTPAVCDRVVKALEIMVAFFHSKGRGLSLEAMETVKLKELNHMLNLRRKETSDLVARYMLELAADQDQKRTVDRGIITVQMGFVVNDKKLCVNVLNGRNMPIMDPTGSSDPLVTLEPFPHHLFSSKSCVVQKTAVQKKTTMPLFDETFYIQCEPSTLDAEGAAILFTCYDWDRFTKDDLIGEAVCLLSDAERVDSASDVNHARQIMLPLSLPSVPKDRQSVYHILNSRKWDKNAVKFIEMRQKIFKLASVEQN